MTLSETAYRHRTVVLLVTALLMLFGASSYFTLPAREDPEITNREAVVTTRYPGLSAGRMELLVTKTLEEAIRQVPEVEEIRSTSRAGISIIHAEVYDTYFKLDQIWDDLRNKVSRAARGLPDGAQTPVVDDDFGDVAVVTAALRADGFEPGAIRDTAQHVRDQLYGVAGTKRVTLHGVQEERIFIEILNTRLAEFGLSADELIATLSAQNIITPGGEVDTGNRAFLIEPTGNFTGLEALREALITLPDGDGVVPLRDLARIQRSTVDPPERTAYFNGEPAIIIAVSMLEGERVLEYAPRVKQRLEAVEASLPVGYQLDLITYQAEQVAKAVYGVSFSVLQTLAIVLAVVILFLGLRTGLIVGSIVPGVMLITLAVMGFTGIALERMSLATLVIALGLLVDNGIVMAEDFKRRLEEGDDRHTALRRTGGELALPLLASTLTTILVFLPLMLADHEAGEYTRSISLVILISLLASWLLAMLVTPLLCHRFMPEPTIDAEKEPRHGKNKGGFSILERLYAKRLRLVLSHRWLFLGVMGVALLFAGWGINQVPNKFFPNSDRAQVLTTLDLPPDVSMRTTDRIVQAATKILDNEDRFPYLGNLAGYAGYGGPRFVLSLSPLDPAANKGFLVANLDDISTMPRALSEMRAMFRDEFPGIDARVTDMFLGPSDPGVIDLQITGPDADFLMRKSREVESMLRAVPGMLAVWNDWESRLSKIVVDVDQRRARRAGVSSRDIALALSGYFTGRPVSEFREGDDIFPIIARAQGAERGDVDRIRTLNVRTANDTGREPVPLSQVARVRLKNDFAVIQREAMTRTVTIQGRPTQQTPEDLVPTLTPKLAALRADLPPGHTIEYDGIVVDSAEGRAALFANMPLCLAVITVLLIGQFGGFKRPTIIIGTIPLIIVGAALGLHVMRADFGFMVILGIFSLAGIIINNAIVLIDRIDIERRTTDGTFEDAIASAAARRLRPILMTTVTTILGLMPLILTRDPLFYGLAVVMSFGLAIGTVLTLGVVPVLYSLFLGREPIAVADSPAPPGAVASQSSD